MRHPRTKRAARLAAPLVALASCDTGPMATPTTARALDAARTVDRSDVDPALRKLDHIVVIYLENRSFDNLYGEFAGADGLAAAAGAPLQVDASAAPYATLPAVPG